MDRIDQLWDQHVYNTGVVIPSEEDVLIFARWAASQMYDKQTAANCVMATLEKLGNEPDIEKLWRRLPDRDKQILMEQMCSAVFAVLRKATQ